MFIQVSSLQKLDLYLLCQVCEGSKLQMNMFCFLKKDSSAQEAETKPFSDETIQKKGSSNCKAISGKDCIK